MFIPARRVSCCTRSSVPAAPGKLWANISVADVFASEDGGHTRERRKTLVERGRPRRPHASCRAGQRGILASGSQFRSRAGRCVVSAKPSWRLAQPRRRAALGRYDGWFTVGLRGSDRRASARPRDDLDSVVCRIPAGSHPLSSGHLGAVRLVFDSPPLVPQLSATRACSSGNVSVVYWASNVFKSASGACLIKRRAPDRSCPALIVERGIERRREPINEYCRTMERGNGCP